MDALSKEIAAFDIGVTIIEPGGAAYRVQSGQLETRGPLPAYDGTPASFARGIRTAPRPSPGDPAKMAAVMIESVDQDPPPLRIALGTDAYGYIHTALSERLTTLESQQALASSTDSQKAPEATAMTDLTNTVALVTGSSITSPRSYSSGAGLLDWKVT